MIDRELDRLAALIAHALLHPRGGSAPGKTPASGATRRDRNSLTTGARRQTAPRSTGRGSTRALDIAVPIGVSNRHVHLSREHALVLLGREEPSRHRDLSQPGQYAASERVTVIGPSGRIEGVRVVGPVRHDTQLELARSDASRLGIDPPVAVSGALDASIGGVTLVGPAGSVKLARGVIVAARHLHLGADDARRSGLRDGDQLDIRCGDGPRAVTLHGVRVRSGAGHATELHLDADEAHAVAVSSGDHASIVGAHPAKSARRPLVTERDVQRIARAGGTLPANALLTPSARDRARALGLLFGP